MKYINIEMICNGKLTGIKVKLYFRLHFWVDNDTHFRFFSDQWKAPLQPCSQGSLLAVPVERERTGNKVGCLYCCKRKKFSVYVRLIFSLQNGGYPRGKVICATDRGVFRVFVQISVNGTLIFGGLIDMIDWRRSIESVSCERSLSALRCLKLWTRLSIGYRCWDVSHVPSGEERGETDVFAG